MMRMRLSVLAAHTVLPLRGIEMAWSLLYLPLNPMPTTKRMAVVRRTLEARPEAMNFQNRSTVVWSSSSITPSDLRPER